MKASEFCVKLQQLILDHGDHELGGEINCCGFSVADVEFNDRENSFEIK